MTPNFLARRPSGTRLVLAVRGAAGTGKSRFGASMAEAGIGRVCFIDLERKARLIPGATGAARAFDPYEIDAHELETFVDWVLHGDGREQGYEGFVLDSWSTFFGAFYTRALEAASREAGRSVFKLNAEQLQALQVQVQAPLRKLCYESGKSVTIIDHLAAAGKEELEENQVGRVVPISASGLEYLVDAVVKLELRQDAFDTVRVATVLKSNIERLPVGREIPQPTFKAFLGALDALETDAVADALPAFLLPEPAAPDLSVEALLAEAAELGFSRSQVERVARHEYRIGELHDLTSAQRSDLLARARAAAPANPAPAEPRAANPAPGPAPAKPAKR